MMALSPNPFLERRTDRTTSDQEFVRLFSPKVLDNLPDEIFRPGVHVLHSPPGGGKTTLLRAMTPGALKGFSSRRSYELMQEAVEGLERRSILHDGEPVLLGVMLSCAAGYADLPPGMPAVENGAFRALLDCRIVQKALRALAEFLSLEHNDALGQVLLRHEGASANLQAIPLLSSAADLLEWAERKERLIYSKLDRLSGSSYADLPQHIRFESVLWLEGVQFEYRGRTVATKRLLMLDDLHKLRELQRRVLKEELTELRTAMPIWLAQRSIAFGSGLLSQGVRRDRDGSAHSLEDLWPSNQQFVSFAKSVLDRRMLDQQAISSESLEPHLRDDFVSGELDEAIARGFATFREAVDPLRGDPQYGEWLAHADRQLAVPSLESLLDLYKTRIQIVRNQKRRQLRLDFDSPLPLEELEGKDSSKEQNAAEIFAHEELGVPYYYGIDRLAAMATTNVNELLFLAASLYDALRTKRVLRHRNPVLSPREQEKALREAAKKKLEFVPRSHTNGTRAHRLILAVGAFCRDKTFELNAPYAPGVTGFKISDAEFGLLESGHSPYSDEGRVLMSVLVECAAENLFVRRPSSATSGRDAGSVFYLNRALCAHFGLPLQYGGWQEVESGELVDWMHRGPARSQKRRLFA